MYQPSLSSTIILDYPNFKLLLLEERRKERKKERKDRKEADMYGSPTYGGEGLRNSSMQKLKKSFQIFISNCDSPTRSVKWHGILGDCDHESCSTGDGTVRYEGER